MGNPPERPVLFLSGLSLNQLPITMDALLIGRCWLGEISGALAVFQQARHQLNQVTRPGAVIKLELQQLVPSSRTRTGGSGQAKKIGAVRNPSHSA
jgi:hypothetical protein